MIRPMTCPICRQPLPQSAAVERYAPFCSERCQLADLHRWFSGQYQIVEKLGPAELQVAAEQAAAEAAQERDHDAED